MKFELKQQVKRASSLSAANCLLILLTNYNNRPLTAVSTVCVCACVCVWTLLSLETLIKLTSDLLALCDSAIKVLYDILFFEAASYFINVLCEYSLWKTLKSNNSNSILKWNKLLQLWPQTAVYMQKHTHTHTCGSVSCVCVCVCEKSENLPLQES